MVLLRDIAKIAGVSPATVSRVINNSAEVKEDKRQ
ncbi:MAG: LacI family DNA-binding transcriptional regulator, partial [Robinsoniella sp.]|nr:LacI family DNA-binding transcriptional regulator [Robinsoniella sp.]